MTKGASNQPDLGNAVALDPTSGRIVVGVTSSSRANFYAYRCLAIP